MSVDTIEVVWRVGAREFKFVLGADGTPRLDPPPAPARRPGPPNRGRPWSPEEEEEIRARLDAAEDAGAIAERLGRSRGAVLARAVRLGLLTEEEAGLRYPVARGDD
ncbi:MAG: hypothetical protein ACOZNI_15080 [Myxococcota bacterium]